MRKFATVPTTLILTLFFCLIFSISPVYSQVSSLMVNGTSTNFTMTSGGNISWSYNLPVGATADGEVWLDLNGNHVIDPATDKSVFIFPQTDGDTTGITDGPPDMDGIANGVITFSEAVGLPPADYILRFTHNGVGQSVWGTVNALTSPAFTISGTVSGPVGFDLTNIIMEAWREDSIPGVGSWNALTDSMGNYTIEMTGDTAGNPWRVEITDPPRPYSVSPTDTNVTVDGNITGINFTLLPAAAQVVGRLLDDAGDSLAFTAIYVSRMDTTFGAPFHYQVTDASGLFWFGLPIGELDGSAWRIAQPYNGDEPITTHMLAVGSLPVISNGDSVSRDMVSYRVNSSIQGVVQLDGVSPNFPVMIFAANEDTAESFVWTDSTTGSFSIPVSDKIADYNLFVNNIFGSYTFPFIMAHPGDAGVIYNITTTGVDDRSGDLPAGYTLGQNYPNPFNPVTTIPYSIPERARVVIAVYDVLGREVAVLVNQIEEPGLKLVTFDAGNLPSGVYSYRISSGSVSQVRKMLVLK